ncbi:MAG: hypothetical protein KA714_12020 [Limnoraphis sp. WC205]|nr:hypothetical protein [Limnoraphis sp. WC205]
MNNFIRFLGDRRSWQSLWYTIGKHLGCYRLENCRYLKADHPSPTR